MLQVIEGGIGMRQEACVDYDVMVSGTEHRIPKVDGITQSDNCQKQVENGWKQRPAV
ncbi:hypothetical protein [Bifidobacterium psychraerophilum]|jgi:hypothetical protein|uniref:hypothetical protein n=1 Tax=Bifidobacterium psychraerophilum TaxID=218140 RepID=UPI0023F4BAD3|nr:hypothetical protein [Bifidobacterium psychraerophilum]MCI1660369.1 hypothetical protein [Bifidobacterium psychraerophilum]MCI1804122.1 hypothetical protein [Bifidobacterium psychraerophilum]MCI2176518.1 hypothetical protein [Bifidobacterium psychraerophilum]MCI2182033.1 hypothetical protein [Bifidobacterium psychraerophilum]